MRHLRTGMRAVDRGGAAVLLALVRAYQLLVSPLLGPVCRYAPSCSSYGAAALREHGAVTGVWLTARRLLRCHPWAAGGWDPVPPRRAAGGERSRPDGSPATRHHTGPDGPLPTRTR